ARDAAITIFGSRSLPEYELTHPFNAAMLTVLLGLGTGCDSRTLKRLGLIALLQNIGQALVPESTLLAPRPLTPEERKAVQQHSLVGAQLVRHFYEFDAVMVATVQQHHERMDGSGYPAGLSGRNVLNMARAVAIADAYDALISQRPYRGPYARQEAIEFIMAFAGELFDLPLAEKFARSVPAYLPGTIVRLDNGEKGIIINSNRGLVGRPVVRVCYGADGRELTLPREIDLAKAENQSRLVAAVLPDWE
ncbi:MAG: HD domain-containing protein, partial [Chloroflexi bacterium]|nr:HD domain-containing protein [Chloroflexota bacterium]